MIPFSHGRKHCFPRTPRARPLDLFHLLILVMLLPGLSACTLLPVRSSSSRPVRVIHIATVFPTTGVDGPLGRALQRGAELALRQHMRLAKGYRVAVTPIDEADMSARRVKTVLRQQRVLGAVGPLDAERAPVLLSAVRHLGIATISPSAWLPHRAPGIAVRTGGSLPAAIPAAAPPVLFSLSPSEVDIARALIRLAVAPPPGLAARSIFLLDDGSREARSLVSDVATGLLRKGGIAAGRLSVAARIPSDVQTTVSAIIEASPDLVFYAGGTSTGAAIRGTLSLSGAPNLRMLTVALIAGNPGWSAAVGTPATAASTIALLPAPDPSAMHSAHRFVSEYHRVFAGKVLLPQSVLAYDAAMDEIAAIKGLIRTGEPLTRRSLRSTIASTPYRGISGRLAFDQYGHDVTPASFRLYVYRGGGWQEQRNLQGG